ncbi:MAG: type II toxin-antitoxin system VapC family toxin [Sporichthyaceae bacterium]
MTARPARGLLDTSVFIARESGRPLDVEALPDQWAISVITVAELRAGVLAAQDLETRDRRLTTLTAALALDPVPVDDAVGQAWARLRLALRDAERRMPVNDSWIAATAVALGVPLVTQDGDLRDLPGVDVVLV